MTERHVVFVDSTLSGLLAFETAKKLGCRATLIEPLDSSFLAISTRDRSRIDPHLVHLDEHRTVPTIAVDALLSELREIAARHPIHALVTTSEAAILPVAEAAHALGLPTPAPQALRDAVFKDRCRHALARAGLRVPHYEVLTEAQLLAGQGRTLRVPLVVKPTRGFGKQFSAVCQTEAQWDAFVAALARERAASDPMVNQIVNRHYIVEEYVTGSLHSTEVILKRGRLQCFATTTRYRSRHNDLLEMGYSMPSGLAPRQARRLEQYVADVCRCLGLDFGLFHVETLYAEDGPCLVEVNGRMMGGVGPQVYQALSGRDAFDLLLRTYLGEAVETDPQAMDGAATVVLIGAKNEGVVSSAFTQERLDALLARHGISFCTLRLAPGMPLRRFDGNVSVLGHAIVHGPDPQASAVRGDAFLRDLDALLGVELAKYLEAPGHAGTLAPAAQLATL